MKNHDIPWLSIFININLVDVEAWNYSWSNYRYVDIYPENYIEMHKHFLNKILF